MYYGHEAGLLRIAELRQKAAAERRAREVREGRHGQEPERSERSGGRRRFRFA